MKLEDVILRGTRASQPVANTVAAGTLYFVTDESIIERSDASVWQSFSVTGGAFSLTQKTAITSRTNNTLTADPTLVVAMLASKTYVVSFRVWFTGSTADDFKFRITGPAAPVTVKMVRRHIPPNTTTYTVAVLEAYDAADINIACNTGDVGFIEIDVIVENGINAGNLAFEWANQNGGGGTSSVNKGSFLQYRELA